LLAFIHSEPKPGAFPHTAAFTGALKRAADHGAAAAAERNDPPPRVDFP